MLGSDTELDKLLSFINDLHTNIKFILEQEINNTLNFLDFTIERKNEQLTLSIYRKPRHTDLTIPDESFHSLSRKLAA